MNLLRIFSIISLSLGGLLACSPPASKAQQSSTNLPTRAELIRKFRQERKMQVIYQGEQAETTEKWAELLTNIKKNLPSWYGIELHQAAEVDDSLIVNHPCLLIGTTAGNPIIEKIRNKLPVSISSTQLELANELFTDPLTSLGLNFIPNPLNPQNPLNIITGLSDQAITDKLTGPSMTDFSNPLWSNYGFEVSRKSERLLLGLFGESWEYDAERSWNFVNEKEFVIKGPVFSLKAHGFDLTENQKKEVNQRVELRWQQIQSFFDSFPEPTPFVYHLYKDAELMGMQRRKMFQGYSDFRNAQVHEIYHRAVLDQEFESFNGYLVQSLWGKRFPDFLAEGFSHFFSSKWQKKGALEWAIRLQKANALLPEEDLWDNQNYERSSMYIRGATVGGLIHFLAEKHKEVLVQACNDPESSQELIKPFFQEYKEYLASFGQTPEARTPASLQFHRGMTFAHEGYNVYDGYASQLGKEALSKIHRLHGNSIAIVPYSGSRNTSKPQKYRLWEGAGGENSMSIVFARYHASEYELKSLLKPQIYYGGAWPGAVKMESKEDWLAWHNYYKQWIMHYAMVAAMFDFEYFCVGVEFVNATLENPELWRQLVKDVREVYRGPVTYAANWGDEAEKIAFADELDFIGVNSYYPLSEKDEPSDEELLQGAMAINKKMEAIYNRTQKPIVFTEVGYRSVEKAWKNPHEEPNGRGVDKLAQSRSYQASLKALDGQPWFKGAYWWKWPSYLGYAKSVQKSFTPCGKEAEEVLEEWYKKWE
ncbi:MAG: hypothetical protein MRZ79_25945 [Bacteroidia bacterium]|nr:hypothetical protein [Bacteroidia bacterium]